MSVHSSQQKSASNSAKKFSKVSQKQCTVNALMHTLPSPPPARSHSHQAALSGGRSLCKHVPEQNRQLAEELPFRRRRNSQK